MTFPTQHSRAEKSWYAALQPPLTPWTRLSGQVRQESTGRCSFRASSAGSPLPHCSESRTNRLSDGSQIAFEAQSPHMGCSRTPRVATPNSFGAVVGPLPIGFTTDDRHAG